MYLGCACYNVNQSLCTTLKVEGIAIALGAVRLVTLGHSAHDTETSDYKEDNPTPTLQEGP